MQLEIYLQIIKTNRRIKDDVMTEVEVSYIEEYRIKYMKLYSCIWKASKQMLLVYKAWKFFFSISCQQVNRW